MARGVSVAAAAVGLHAVASLVHGLPHAAIPVELAAWQDAFVFGVVAVAPVVALGLLWRGRNRSGAALLVASMAASLAFGLWFHFLVPNPDHVHAVPAGAWGRAFRATAVGAAVADALGVLAGVRAWRQASASSSTSSGWRIS